MVGISMGDRALDGMFVEVIRQTGQHPPQYCLANFVFGTWDTFIANPQKVVSQDAVVEDTALSLLGKGMLEYLRCMRVVGR